MTIKEETNCFFLKKKKKIFLKFYFSISKDLKAILMNF